MKKIEINYWIDFILFFGLIIVGLSGIILFLLPSGPGSSWIYVLGITKHNWGEIHKWAGLLMIFIGFIHLILHWNWFIAMTKNKFL